MPRPSTGSSGRWTKRCSALPTEPDGDTRPPRTRSCGTSTPKTLTPMDARFEREPETTADESERTMADLINSLPEGRDAPR